tara:strand:+ start:350 stop:1315 length:966 start_codon:yes stop_codon:yes gene_type:complete
MEQVRNEMKTLFENWRGYINEQEADDSKKNAAMAKLVVLSKRLYSNIDGGDGILSQWGGGQDKATDLAWTKDLLLMIKMRLNRVKAGEYGEPPPKEKVDLKRMLNRVFKGINNFMDAMRHADKLTGKSDEDRGLQEKSQRRLRREAEGEVDVDKTFQRAKGSLVRSFKRIIKKLTWDDKLGSAGSGFLTPSGVEGTAELLSLLEDAEDAKDVNVYLGELKDGIMDSGTTDRWIQGHGTALGDSDQHKTWSQFQEQIRKFENSVLDITENGLESALGVTEEMINIIRTPELEEVWLEDIEELLLDVIAKLAKTDRQVAGWQW